MQVSPVLAGTLGFGVKRAEIPGLQRHLLDLDPFADPLTEEFWETVCFMLSVVSQRPLCHGQCLLHKNMSSPTIPMMSC